MNQTKLRSVLRRYRNGSKPRVWWEFRDGHRERIVVARKVAHDCARVETETREFTVPLGSSVYGRPA